MITKGIIKSIDFSGNTCSVRIPYFETAGSDEVICTATISNVPGIYNGYKEEDVVWVAFEDNLLSNPVVIGKLYLGVAKEKQDPRGTINCVNSTASNSAALPYDTKILDLSDGNTVNTSVPHKSLTSLATTVASLENDVIEMGNDFGNKLVTIVDEIDAQGTNYSSAIIQTAKNIENKVNKISANGESNSFGWNLTSDDWSVYSETTDSQDAINSAVVTVQRIAFPNIQIIDGQIVETITYVKYLFINGIQTNLNENDYKDPDYSDWRDDIWSKLENNKESENITTFVKANNCLGTSGENWTFSYQCDPINTYIAYKQKPVMRVDKNGLTVNGNGVFNGTIEANEGHIGGSTGFVITNEAIYKNKATIDTAGNGIYIGTNGIAINDGFKVTAGTTGKVELKDYNKTTVKKYRQILYDNEEEADEHYADWKNWTSAAWDTNVPPRVDGQYIWEWTQEQKGNDTWTDLGRLCVTGATGPEGPGGSPGKGVTSVAKYFNLASSWPAKPTTNPPSGNWKTSPDSWETGKKYYESELTVYDNGTFSWSDVIEDAMLDVNFINSLNIEAKKISIKNGDDPIFIADSLVNPYVVRIGGFTVNTDSLYDGMTSLEDTTHDGVYVGTSGIALGKGAFKVTNTGALTATSATITGAINATSLIINSGTSSATDIGDALNTATANAVTDVSNALDNASDPINQKVVTIANGAITAAKITANEISVEDEYENTLLYANADSKTVSMAGFDVFDGQITSGTVNTTNYVKLGIDEIALGKTFKVTNAGDLTSTSGTIGGFEISANGLSKEETGTNPHKVSITTTAIEVTGRYATTTRTTKIDNAGVDTTYLQAKEAYIGGTINSSHTAEDGKASAWLGYRQINPGTYASLWGHIMRNAGNNQYSTAIRGSYWSVTSMFFGKEYIAKEGSIRLIPGYAFPTYFTPKLAFTQPIATSPTEGWSSDNTGGFVWIYTADTAVGDTLVKENTVEIFNDGYARDFYYMIVGEITKSE